MSHTHTHTSSAAPLGNQQVNGHISQPENATPPRVLREPPTGKQFLESLQDGRVIYFDGMLVKDVTTHPAFATSARSYARMYDALHDQQSEIC